jgi:S-adenosylmethionine uptake transporter
MTCVGYGFLCIADAAMKLIAAKYHFSVLLVSMGLLMAALIGGYGLVTEGRAAFRVRQWKWVMVRAVLGTACSICNIYSFPHVPLTIFYTLVFTCPFWIALLSSVFLKEQLPLRSLAVILFGFGVVAYVFQPGSGLFNPWTLVVLLGSFLYSCSMIAVRKAGPEESRTMLVVMAALTGVVFGLPFLPGNAVLPAAFDLGVIFIVALTTGIGIVCVMYAFQHAPSAAVVAPFHYTQIIWGALLGYGLFNETPGLRVIAGALLIILSGLYLIYSEAQSRRKFQPG